jgi:uncharacterized protein (DUF1810 family)
MADEFQHFLDAQNQVFDQVVEELAQGEKRSHWMWFVFPQLSGLGHSHMAQKYALSNLDQAQRYAWHPELGNRLRQCTQVVIQVEGRGISEIFGYPDDLKFCSCMTLFSMAVPDEPLFEAALKKYFNGQKDARTLALLQGSAG